MIVDTLSQIWVQNKYFKSLKRSMCGIYEHNLSQWLSGSHLCKYLRRASYLLNFDWE